MDSLLNMWIHGDHFLIQLRMLSHHYLWIPGCSNENSVQTTAERCGEDVGDLQADQESKGHNDHCVVAIVVVAWMREHNVEIGQESAQIRDSRCAHCKDRTDKTLVDQRVDTTIDNQPIEFISMALAVD